MEIKDMGKGDGFVISFNSSELAVICHALFNLKPGKNGDGKVVVSKEDVENAKSLGKEFLLKSMAFALDKKTE